MKEFYNIVPALGDFWRVMSSCGNQIKIATRGDCVVFCERFQLNYQIQ